MRHDISAPLQLVMEVLKHLEGAYALLFKSSLYPGEMVACKRGSPLILGIRAAPDGSTTRLASVHDESLSHAAESLECFIASDASAVVEHTKKCARARLYHYVSMVRCRRVEQADSWASCHTTQSPAQSPAELRKQTLCNAGAQHP